ncbi:MAG: hypothetical protein Q4Q32_03640 [Methanobrevibacter sp.]|nr:hypothetical protein [Methanobrevibacter sp.]
MIERTELGVLISYETWEELQEKLEKSNHSQEVQTLKEENKNLKNALKQVELFLNKGVAHV